MSEEIATLSQALSQSQCVTREDLHLKVRSVCKIKKIVLGNSSPAYRSVVVQCLLEFLKVESLSSDQYKIVDNWCDQVPSFYRKYKSSLKDVMRHHGKYFENPLVYSVDGVDTFIMKDSVSAM